MTRSDAFFARGWHADLLELSASGRPRYKPPRVRSGIEAEANEALRRMPRNTAQWIRSKLLALAADPFARRPNVKKLAGREGFRLRFGNWRALYTIDPDAKVISVMVIKPRGAAYG